MQRIGKSPLLMWHKHVAIKILGVISSRALKVGEGEGTDRVCGIYRGLKLRVNKLVEIMLTICKAMETYMLAVYQTR